MMALAQRLPTERAAGLFDPTREHSSSLAAVPGREIAVMRSNDSARDRQPQPGAAVVRVSRIVAPIERVE